MLTVVLIVVIHQFLSIPFVENPFPTLFLDENGEFEYTITSDTFRSTENERVHVIGSCEEEKVSFSPIPTVNKIKDYTFFEFMECQVKDDFSFCAERQTGVVVLNVADTSHPYYVSRIDSTTCTTYSSGCSEMSIHIDGDLLALCDSSNDTFYLNDISDPFNSFIVGTYNLGGSECKNAIVDGDRVFISQKNGDLLVLNVTDPTTPYLIEHYSTGCGTNLSRINYMKETIYLACSSKGFKILNVTSNSVSVIYENGLIESKEALPHPDGNLLYVFDQIDLYVYNISDSLIANPILTGSANDINIGKSELAYGNAFPYMFIPGIYTIEIIDTNHTDPSVKRTILTDTQVTTHRMYVRGTELFVPSVGGLLIYNVSNIDDATVDPPLIGQCGDVLCDGVNGDNYAGYVEYNDETGEVFGYLMGRASSKIYNLTDLENGPTTKLLSILYYDNGSRISAANLQTTLVFDNTYLYLSTIDRLHVYHVGDKTNPYYVSEFLSGSHGCLTGSEKMNVLYRFSGSSTPILRAIDVTDRENPSLLRELGVDCLPDFAELSDDFLYFSCNSMMYIYNVSDRSDVVFVSSIPTSTDGSVTASHDYAVVQDGSSSPIYDVSDKSTPVYESSTDLTAGNIPLWFSFYGNSFLFVIDSSSRLVDMKSKGAQTYVDLHTLGNNTNGIVGGKYCAAVGNTLYVIDERGYKIYESENLKISNNYNFKDDYKIPFSNECVNTTITIRAQDSTGSIIVEVPLSGPKNLDCETIYNNSIGVNCEDPEKPLCMCNEHWYGQNCSVTTCFGVFGNDTTTENICSGMGDCIDFDRCSCEDGYFGKLCNITTCFGGYSNSSDTVCSGHGVCHSHNNCSCADNYTEAEDCSIWRCDGKMNSETGYIKYVGGNPYPDWDANVCNGHGVCHSHENCSCSQFYNEEFCNQWSCYGVLRTSVLTCTTHGTCVGHDTCECQSERYTGDKCHQFTCFNISSQRADVVCGSHGSCIDEDVCSCFFGYTSSTYESPCDTWECHGTNKNKKDKVCSERGDCHRPDECACKNSYEGEDCETWSCGLDYRSPGACTGRGSCSAPQKCKCKSGYSGTLCENNDMYLTILVPVLGGTGILVVGLICLGLGICLCALLVCVLAVLAFFGVLFLVLDAMGLYAYWTRKKMKKFGQLKNLDIILSEQKMEDSVDIAHFKMNKDLFKIPIKEVEVIRILGEGGSQSTVYLAKWQKRRVAFKCFRTRLICSSVDSFDEFEKEVSVFASISHPNVVRFFGCTLNPPRVGIIMEFCEKGECLEYIKECEKKDLNTVYPMKERIRMLREVISSMRYLHSRSIIHRDLKTENVLLNEMEQCKLMDFGLSKISERLSKQRTKGVGTSFYMAPEVVLGLDTYSEKCDIFSFGIFTYILITGLENPYIDTVGDDTYGIELRVANDPDCRPTKKVMGVLLEKKDRWIIPLMEECWKSDPEERPSFETISEEYERRLYDNVGTPITPGGLTPVSAEDRRRITEEIFTNYIADADDDRSDKEEKKESNFKMIDKLKKGLQELKEEMLKKRKKNEELKCEYEIIQRDVSQKKMKSSEESRKRNLILSKKKQGSSSGSSEEFETASDDDNDWDAVKKDKKGKLYSSSDDDDDSSSDFDGF